MENNNKHWTIADHLEDDLVKAICICGRTVDLSEYEFNKGRGLGHRCPLTHPLMGERFGRLIVVAPTQERRRNNIVLRCACDCGEETTTIAAELRRGNVRSCGCLQREIASARASLRFPVSEMVSYASAHNRLRLEKGRASDYMCVCGERASQWAYDGMDPDEIIGTVTHRGMSYSLKASHYHPLCHTCHHTLDHGDSDVIAVLLVTGDAEKRESISEEA